MQFGLLLPEMNLGSVSMKVCSSDFECQYICAVVSFDPQLFEGFLLLVRSEASRDLNTFEAKHAAEYERVSDLL